MPYIMAPIMAAKFAVISNSSDSRPTKTVKPINPIMIPKSCKSLNLKFRNIIENKKAKRGVVPFITAIEPALICNDA